MHKTILAAAILSSIFSAQAAAGRTACMGDADSDGRVEVSEIIALTDCALQRLTGCGTVRVNHVVTAIDKALKGCDPVWLELIPCRQCEGCLAGFEHLFLGTASGIPEQYLPSDITVLDFTEDTSLFACQACGCPGGPIYSVLVPSTDVKRLAELGWTVGR